MAWEYEGLFEKIPETTRPMPDGEQTTFWQSTETTARAGRMQYRTATIRSGDMLEAEVYPIWGRDQSDRARRARENLTPIKQQKVNQKRRERYFERLVEANFTAQDIHLTLTFAEGVRFREAQKEIRNFLKRVKRRREQQGLDALRYIYVIEGDPEGRRQRIHAHMLLNGGLERKELERIWGKGFTNADQLQPDENGLQGLARYMIKQRKEEDWQPGRRTWCASRNLKKPQVRISDTKVSNRRVQRIAMDFDHMAREIMERIYPGYRFCECDVMISDYVSGVYIRCKLRKRREGHHV